MKKVFLVCVSTLISLGSYAQVGAAMTSLSSGKLDQAKTQIDKASTDEKASTKSKTWFYKGEVYKAIAQDPTGLYSKLDSNALQVAYDSYQKAKELEPNSTFAKQATDALPGLFPVALNQGAVKYQAKDYANASKFFTMARTLNPKDTTAALYAGIANQGNNNLKAAAESFEALIDLGTNDPSIYTVTGQIYRTALNDPDKALAVVKKGVAKFPANKQLKDEEFNLNMTSGKMDEAKNNLLESIKREPNNAEYLQNLGILYDTSGDKEKAKEYYDKALAIDPNSYDANFNLGVLYYNKGADISKKLREMDLKQYQKDGKRLETEMKDNFTKALANFEKNYAAKKDDRNVLEPLKNIYMVLGRKADEEKIDKQLQALK